MYTYDTFHRFLCRNKSKLAISSSLLHPSLCPWRLVKRLHQRTSLHFGYLLSLIKRIVVGDPRKKGKSGLVFPGQLPPFGLPEFWLTPTFSLQISVLSFLFSLHLSYTFVSRPFIQSFSNCHNMIMFLSCCNNNIYLVKSS